MFGRNKFLAVLNSFVLLALAIQDSLAAPQPVRELPKISVRKQVRTSPKRAGYLIPPPPAYMPSILPETFFVKAGKKANPSPAKLAEAKSLKGEEPRPNYIFEVRGHETARPVFSRNGVTQWISPEPQVHVSSAL